MTTRSEIEARAARYLHRTDYTSEDLDLAWQIATAELGTRLRCPENERVDVIAAADVTNPLPLPAELRQIRAVELYQAGQRVDIGNPRDYQVRGGAVYFRLAPVGDVTVYGWVEPDAITSDPGSTNAVLTQYPELYLWRILVELAGIAQDVDLVNGWGAAWAMRLEEINTQARNMQYGAGLAMVGR